jgi:hypothetical protein
VLRNCGLRREKVGIARWNITGLHSVRSLTLMRNGTISSRRRVTSLSLAARNYPNFITSGPEREKNAAVETKTGLPPPLPPEHQIAICMILWSALCSLAAAGSPGNAKCAISRNWPPGSWSRCVCTPFDRSRRFIELSLSHTQTLTQPTQLWPPTSPQIMRTTSCCFSCNSSSLRFQKQQFTCFESSDHLNTTNL